LHDKIISEDAHLIGFQTRVLMSNMKRAFEALQYETFPDQTAVSHGWVVGYLYRHSDADIYQKDLEKTFHMAPSSITAMVKSLEKSGLIRREPVEKDARLKRIVLTEEGVTFQERTMENFDRLEAAAVEGIPPEDVEKFFAVLIQANQNIKKFNKEAKVADNI
jgi:MarR family transcriptional repressor of mepA